MTTESIFTHDDDGNLQLQRPEAWDQRIRDLERRIAELERTAEKQAERLALAGIREDRG